MSTPPRNAPRFNVPDQGDAPLVWDPERREFVPGAQPAEPPRDTRRFYVGPEAVGKRLPPAPGGVRVANPPSRPAGTLPPRRDPPPAPAPAAPPSPPPSRPTDSRRRRRWPFVVGIAVLVPVVLAAVALVWANWKFSQIERVEVSDLLDAGGAGTNYLIVGSDSREGIDPNAPNAGAIVGEGAPGGQRADTMLILRTQGDAATMLSIPRDLFVTIAETGDEARINAAYNGGPRRLIPTIRDNLGIPIHRYVEVDFVTFAGLVDAVGGVTIEFPHPAFDDNSGLNVTEAGLVELDGTQALAYVRSRHYTEVIDGDTRTDPTGDHGRVLRQQQFLRAVLGKAGGSRNPITLMRVGNSVVGGLRIDDGMGFWDAVRFAWRMGKLDPVSVPLPTEAFRTDSGAAVLRLADGAEAVLAQFR